MITSITNSISTAAYTELSDEILESGKVADVRELVDRRGNSVNAIKHQIEKAADILLTQGEVFIACDMGVSRSRVIAVGLLVRIGYDFDAAFRLVMQKAGDPEINLQLLRSLQEAILVSHSRKVAQAEEGILVLGGSGFVGREILASLRHDFQVYAPTSREIDLRTGTIDLFRFIDAYDCKQILYSIHPKSHHSTQALSSSVGMLKNALDVAVETGCRFVYLSSLVVFNGNAKSTGEYVFDVSEEVTPFPFGTYSESKWLGEQLVQIYRVNHGLQVTVVRPSGLYGNEMSPVWLIPKLVEKAKRGLPIVTHEYQNGLPAFELLHIRDFCAGIKLLLGQINMPDLVHIGSSEVITTRDLASCIVEILDSSSDLSLEKINDNTHTIRSIPSDIMKATGWAPAIPIREGLGELIQTCSRW